MKERRRCERPLSLRTRQLPRLEGLQEEESCIISVSYLLQAVTQMQALGPAADSSSAEDSSSDAGSDDSAAGCASAAGCDIASAAACDSYACSESSGGDAAAVLCLSHQAVIQLQAVLQAAMLIQLQAVI